MTKSFNPCFRYALGDLVKYRTTRWTEEYSDVVEGVGIVTGQRYCFSTSNRFKVKSPADEKWINADNIIEIISKAPKII